MATIFYYQDINAASNGDTALNTALELKM